MKSKDIVVLPVRRSPKDFLCGQQHSIALCSGCFASGSVDSSPVLYQCFYWSCAPSLDRATLVLQDLYTPYGPYLVLSYILNPHSVTMKYSVTLFGNSHRAMNNRVETAINSCSLSALTWRGTSQNAPTILRTSLIILSFTRNLSEICFAKEITIWKGEIIRPFTASGVN